jgi:hypothetical protein
MRLHLLDLGLLLELLLDGRELRLDRLARLSSSRLGWNDKE